MLLNEASHELAFFIGEFAAKELNFPKDNEF